MSDFAATVKQQADIVKIVEGYIRLRKAGAQNWTGLCPFHKEKSPSFNVNAVRQFYYCFGCQATGDVFTFVGKMENVGFPEAVRLVAQKCGIPLPKREYSSPEEAAEARLRRKLLDLHEAAAAWFEERLRGPEGAAAREYLAGRGLTPEGIKTFRIGYAPDSFNALRDALSPLADAETLRASGLFSQKEREDGTVSPLYDRFRKRVVFPIANESGRVIAFTARTLEAGEKAGAKYINSPETPLYSKGHVLFNLDKAKAAIRQLEFALLVEGQMDCISVYLRGIQNVIATSGTAFTEHQVAILKRHTGLSADLKPHAGLPPKRPQVVLNFDPDTAGSSAAAKTEQMLAREGFAIKIAVLDDGLDPDRFIRERGLDAYVQAIRGAKPRSIFYIDRALQLFPGHSTDQKLNQLNYVLPHINDSREVLERNEFAADAAQKLGIESALIREELRLATLQRRSHLGSGAAEAVRLPSIPPNLLGISQRRDRENAQRLSAIQGGALAEGIARAHEGRPELVQPRLTKVELALIRALSNDDPENHETRMLVIEAITSDASCFEHLELFEAMRSLAGRRAGEPMAVIEDPSQRALIAEALSGEAAAPTVREVESAIQGLKEVVIERRQRALRALIAETERRGDTAELAVLTKQKLELDRALRQLHRANFGGEG